MNAPKSPCLDPRTRQDIAQEVHRRLGWPDAPRDDLREALIAVFARFAERLGQRLNSAPQQQFAAFAELLSPTRFAARAAATVLVFKPVARPTGGPPTPVPAGTQVAGPPPAGSAQPLVFETQVKLALSPAALVSSFTATAQNWTPWMNAASAPDPAARPRPLPAQISFALPDAAATPVPTALVLEIEVEPASMTAPPCEWFLLTDKGEQPLVPASDGTDGLRCSGEVVFLNPPISEPTVLQGRSGRWLCARGAGAGLVKLALFSVRHDVLPHAPQAGFWGAAPVDLSRDFLPLGPRPQFGDVFTLRDAAFALPGAQIVLTVKLTNPSDAQVSTPIPRVATEHAPALQWDAWTARGWVSLGHPSDGTESLTRGGLVQFSLPADATDFPGGVGGAVRLRLSRGDYAVEPKPGAKEPVWQPVLHHPPSIERVSVAATARCKSLAPRAVLLQRGLQAQPLVADVGGRLAAPEPLEDGAGLYLGFGLPANTEGAGHTLQFVLQTDGGATSALADPESGNGNGSGSGTGSGTTADLPVWQYRVRDGWVPALVEPLPCELPGRVALRVVVGGDWQRWATSSVDPTLHWLRLHDAAAGSAPPRISGVLLNAVPACEQSSLFGEVLGSSDGTPKQQFELARGRVIGETTLEVGEPGPLPAEAVQRLCEDGHALRIEPALGRLPEIAWVQWRQAADFSEAGPESRVYVLDAERGVLRFGDGRLGRIPPPGPNNVRMAAYRFGGGLAGNCPPGTLKQLRGSVIGVESVSQPEAATGGLDAESPGSAHAGATAWLRHRDRAVGPDDYADLACRATPAVARARCLSARDLNTDGLGQQAAPGWVSVAVLPNSADDPAPSPSVELLAQVRAVLQARGSPHARLTLCGPLYVGVDTEVEVLRSASADASALAASCEASLTRFLNPVTGGLGGQGWAFGRWPHVSELHAALAGVAGLAEIRRLQRRLVEPRPGALRAPHALLRAGQCRVLVVG